jgi:capsular exopolysaccharide synthesis family protein
LTSTTPEISTQQNKSNSGSTRDMLFRYVLNLPLFILCMVICLGGANIYLRYIDKVYLANSQILVGGSGAVSASNGDLISQGLFGVRAINIDNELELLRSKKLIERVVRKGQFNIRYFNEGTIKRMELYNLSPLVVNYYKLKDSSSFWSVSFTKLDNLGAEYQFAKSSAKRFNWGDTLILPFGNIVVNKRMAIVSNNENPHTIEWTSIRAATDDIRAGLSVKSLSAKTTIISLSLLSSNPSRAADILNLLGYEFAEQDVELKREISISTLNFIDDRLRAVSNDLRKIDSSKVDVNGNSRFLDIGSELAYYQNKYGQTESRLEDAFVDTAVIRLLEDYVKDDRNKYKKIFSPLGLGDPTLGATISKFNDLVTERDKAAFENPDDNIIINAIENKLENMRTNVLISLANVKRAYGLRIQIFNERNNEYADKMGEIPDKNALEMELKKQKELKERLYLYLLQKREETAIAAISSKSNYSNIDAASYSTVPIEPKEKQIKNFAFLLGLLVPIAFLYLFDLLNDKIISRNDIANKTSIPVVGEVSHLDGKDEIVVNKTRSIIAEQFRIMRSNLQFILPVNRDGKAKTFLITSTISGEGKSFISTNLAGVLELTEKKVALLEFDLRKLKSLKVIKNEEFDKGITNFLIGQTDNLEDLAYFIDAFPNLHVYKTGPLPPNPSELMIGERMDILFAKLRDAYDYIVIDSAPVGLVSDAFALDKYSDITIFILRQRFSLKKQIDFVNELKDTQKFKNIVLAINDINLSGRYGYYGYGYSYGYQYNYGYGTYGSGYGSYGSKIARRDPYFSGSSNPYFDEKKKSLWQRIWRR